MYQARFLVLVSSFLFQVSMLRSSSGFRKVEQVQNKMDDWVQRNNLTGLLMHNQVTAFYAFVSTPHTQHACLYQKYKIQLLPLQHVCTHREWRLLYRLMPFSGTKDRKRHLVHEISSVQPQLLQWTTVTWTTGTGHMKLPRSPLGLSTHPKKLPNLQPPQVHSCDHRKRRALWSWRSVPILILNTNGSYGDHAGLRKELATIKIKWH